MHRSLRSSALVHGESREQSRDTDPELLRLVERVHPVGLDPCASSTSLVPARRLICTPFNARRSGNVEVENGLLVSWRKRIRAGECVFVNPPWEDLEVWIPKMAEEAADGTPIIALLPLRSHRNYWPPVWTADVCFLPPVRFGEFRDCIATPCVMIYWGPHRDLFESVFSPLGHVQRGTMPREIQGKGVALLRDILRNLADDELRVVLSKSGKTLKDIIEAASDLGGPDGERLRSLALASPVIDSSKPLSLIAVSAVEDTDSERILRILASGPISGSAVGEALGVSENTALRRLKELLKLGKVRRMGGGRGTRWKVTEKNNAGKRSA